MRPELEDTKDEETDRYCELQVDTSQQALTVEYDFCPQAPLALEVKDEESSSLDGSTYPASLHSMGSPSQKSEPPQIQQALLHHHPQS